VGQGAYGTVHRVQFANAELLAKMIPGNSAQSWFGLKEMLPRAFMAEGRIKEVFVEKTVLADLKHPGVIKLHSSFGSNAKLYLLIEYCANGSLDMHLSRKGTLNLQEVR
jgi:serine/threonine protein kinase